MEAVIAGCRENNFTHPFYSPVADGPLRGMVAIASGAGKCRGFVGSPMLGKMSLLEAVGKGVLQVVKNHPDWPNSNH